MSNDRNHEVYTESMAHSIWDKAFFMDKIGDADTVIDFGCADGSMIHMLRGLFPKKKFYGYDNDPQMISLAKMKYGYEGWWQECELDEMIDNVLKSGAKSICLNFSSVLHEVFSVSGGIAAIRSILTYLPVDYISIRDMYYHVDEDYPIFVSLPSEFILQFDQNKVMEFVMRYGQLNNWKNIVHFLMKYQWINNGWEEELNENYFSWTKREFLGCIRTCWRGDVVFEAHYQLPHLCYRWFRDYGIWIPDIHTHAQFVLARH